MSDSVPFDQRRLLPRGCFARGPGLRSLISASLATVCLILAAFDLALLTGVITTTSPRTMSVFEAAAIEEALGDRTPVPLTELAEYGTGQAQISNAGVLPLLVHGDFVGPGWMIAIARWFPTLLVSTTAIPVLAGFAVIFLLAHHFLELWARSSTELLAADAASRIRSAIHRQALRLNLGDLDGRGRRHARNLFTTQTDTIRDSISRCVFHALRDPGRIVICVCVLFLIDWRLALLTLIPCLGAAWFIASERTRESSLRRLADSRALRARRLLSEGLSKSRLIRGYGMETDELKRFDEQLARYTAELSAGADSWRHRQRLSWAAGLIAFGIVAYLVGMKVAFDPHMTSADGALFVLALTVLLLTAVRAEGVLGMWKTAGVLNQQVNRYLDQIPDVSQAVGAKFLNPVEKGIGFEAITVKHRGSALLDNLELRLPANSRTAFVSLDPLEAKAAAFLLPRFIEPTSGRVLFDGEDIAWGTLESLRAECCYVGGREPFFTGTVLENIGAGDHVSESEIIEAAKQCHAHNLISKLSDGYETTIGEHGVSLPVGHAFLLGLARAIVRDPAVMIIDEPASELDQDTKSLIEDAYQRVLQGRTVIFLPQRLSTVRRADNVVLFSAGRVAATGAQRELVKANELYRHWEYVHFSPFGKRFNSSAQLEQAVSEFDAEQSGTDS